MGGLGTLDLVLQRLATVVLKTWRDRLVETVLRSNHPHFLLLVIEGRVFVFFLGELLDLFLGSAGVDLELRVYLGLVISAPH